MDEPKNYMSAESLAALKEELKTIKDKTIPEIAKRIDEAKQQGDLSENAEYHQAREDMSWTQGRLYELEELINSAEIITAIKGDSVALGSKVTVKVGDKTKEYTIVGPQEIDLAKGHISNESPIGEALLGHKKGDKVEVSTPAGVQIYEILKIE
jgi:transcription elongation factor GreA